MNFLKAILKKKILLAYDDLNEDFLHNLKVIKKDKLNIKISSDRKIDLTIKGSLYNFLILPHFSKFFIFFYSLKIPMIFPLPHIHLEFLKKNGINNYKYLSLILFYLYIFFTSLKKTYSALKHIINIKKKKFIDNSINVFFPKVTDLSQLPNKNNFEKNYTFIESSIEILNIKPNNIFHNNKKISKFSHNDIEYDFGFPINGLNLINKLFLIFISIFNFIYYSLLIFFKWQNLYLLDQITYKNFFKLSNSSKNFKHINHVIYDFHDQLLRPYWTYFVNKNDYNFHLINSASGFYGFKNKNNKYPIDTMYHHLCNWKNYYVDSEIFYEHIKKIIPSTILLKKKISPFHVSEKHKYDHHKMINVSIFDVIPHNLYSRAFMLPEDRYRVSEICIKFLSDIIKCLDSNDIIIYLKSKHHLNSNSYPQDYINFVKNINKDNIVKLNPRYSPKLLAENMHFSISSPFTTAAFYNTKCNYNFFYDPINVIHKDDRAKQNLNLICGFDELEKHIVYLIKKIRN